MCSSCHRDRPVCPVALQGGAVCRAGEEDYKTDTDLDSRPDSSVLEEPLAESELHEKMATGFAELHEKVASGKYDEVLSEVNRYKAYLQLVEGKALHAMAGMKSGNEKRDALRYAQDAGRKSEELLSKLSPERQEKTVRDIYAEALLLQANTGARLAENDAMFETARDKAKEAVKFLEMDRFPNLTAQAAALRVSGAVELAQKRYETAESFFRHALKKFVEGRQCGVQESGKTVWHAVAYWNMYIVKKETGDLEAAVAWLKQATLLHKSMHGEDHPYTTQYRDCLVTLHHQTKLDLSDNEVRTIERALDIDLPESLPWSPWGWCCVYASFTVAESTGSVLIHWRTFGAFDMNMMHICAECERYSWKVEINLWRVGMKAMTRVHAVLYILYYICKCFIYCI